MMYLTSVLGSKDMYSGIPFLRTSKNTLIYVQTNYRVCLFMFRLNLAWRVRFSCRTFIPEGWRNSKRWPLGPNGSTWVGKEVYFLSWWRSQQAIPPLSI